MGHDRVQQVIGHLDGALAEALTVITQHFLHASILKAQDHPLAPRYYEEWVETMTRSDRVLSAILALAGRPGSREPTRIGLGHEVRQILDLDIAQGERWLDVLEAAARGCASAGSDENASMLKGLIEAERAVLYWRRRRRAELAEADRGAPPVPPAGGPLIEALDDVLRTEISAITQVYYHGLLLEAWGEKELGEFHAAETWAKTWRSVDLSVRLLSMGGHPGDDGHGQLRIGGDVGEILGRDRELVVSQLAALDRALERCDPECDPETLDLLSRTRAGEQKHADWIAAQPQCRDTHPAPAGHSASSRIAD